MTTMENFLARCESYAAQRRITSSYLSRLLFDDGKAIAALREGAGITLRRLERAEAKLSHFEERLSSGALKTGVT